MARERLAADYSWRLLAGKLTELGFAALRFDFSATGDSAGCGSDPDLVASWVSDVHTALDHARTATEAPVVLLGHRLGALLAVEALRGGARTDALVLWDPVLRGKRYLRELRAQQLLAVPGEEAGPASGWADVPGDDLSVTTAAQIARLNLLAGGALPIPRNLVLGRTGAEDALRPLTEGTAGTVEGLDGQAELLNLDPIQAVHAYDTVTRISSWIDDATGPNTPRRSFAVDAPMSLAAPAAATLTVNTEPAGWDMRSVEWAERRVVERAGFFAGGRIFAIVTEPSPEAVRSSAATPPTVLLLSAGVEVHTGPGRLWVDLARQWACRGLRVIRCDMPGIGESPASAGGLPQPVYEADTIDDLEALVREIAPDDPGSVTLLGMCSGAYNALEVAHRVKARQLIALAFGWWLVPAEFRRQEPIDRRRVLYKSGLALLRPLVTTAAGRRLLAGHPERLWLSGSSARLAAPLRPFRKVVRAGTAVTIVMGPSDMEHFSRQPGPLKRLRKRPGFALDVIAGLDHGLLSGGPRRRARQDIFELLAGPVEHISGHRNGYDIPSLAAS
jgi:alpha-beta hydrolase superfamily lysophospholipase